VPLSILKFTYKNYIFFLQRTSGTNLVEDENYDDHDDNVLQTPKIQSRIRTTMGELYPNLMFFSTVHHSIELFH